MAAMEQTLINEDKKDAEVKKSKIKLNHQELQK
jgi:hypothetical protein